MSPSLPTLDTVADVLDVELVVTLVDLESRIAGWSGSGILSHHPDRLDEGPAARSLRCLDIEP